MEKLKILSVTGGIPRYLEEINPCLSAEENIKNICFKKGALLVDEFDRMFSSVFLRNSSSYKDIVMILSSGPKEFTEICDELKGNLAGRVLEYLEELELSGFIKKDYTWNFSTGHDSKIRRYRLSDNYLRFYLKYIDKYKTKIERDNFSFKTLSALPGWDTMMALQFENLVLNNREYIWQELDIRPEDIISENPFFQRKTTKTIGCQIDYMIQTRFDTLYICEIKLSKNIIGREIIEEMQKKIRALKKPKGFSCRAVLIHVNGVQESVIEDDYFSNIINFGQLFDGKVIDYRASDVAREVKDLE